MAERLELGSYDRLHHFISSGVWDAAPVEAELLVQPDKLVGGRDAVLVIDDTATLKKGKHSVGFGSGVPRPDRRSDRLHVRFHFYGIAADRGQSGQGDRDANARTHVGATRYRNRERTNFDAPGWCALVLPAATPEVIVQRLNKAMSEALDSPVVHDRLKGLGNIVALPPRRTPEYLATFIRSEIAKWAGPIRASGTSLD